MRMIFLSLALAGGVAYAQASADVQPLLRALNAARAQGCDGRPGQPVPLRENPRLSAAAALMAGGTKLGDAMQSSDYRAQRANQIALRGFVGPTAAAQGAAANFCGTVLDGELVEAGIHTRGPLTWIVLAAPFSPPSTAQEANVQARVLELVNAARSRPRNCGNKSFPAVRPLRPDGTLHRLAEAHADDMAAHSYFSHTGRDGSKVADRATRARYNWQAIGENIAAGQQKPETAVEGWIKSPGHCANIMSADYAEMGVAFAVNNKSSAGIYWVQVFGTPR
jgi:uncharacterized protein YkwD